MSGCTLTASISTASPRKYAAAVKSAAPVARESTQTLKYEELEHCVGKDVIVRTTFNTTRRGILLKYTIAGLTLKLVPEQGSIELSVPRETIREASVVIPPADPLFPKLDDAGAKKN